MAVLTYDGISLPWSNFSNFAQEAAYDDSGTDWCLTRFDITVNCLISGNYLSQLAPDLTAGSTDSAAAVMKVIRSRLLKPRRALSVKFNGVELIPQPQTGLPGTVDAENGPKPQYCNITQFTNVLFYVSFRIKAAYWENNTVDPASSPPSVINSPGNPVLWNRWSEGMSIDRVGFSKRWREGKVVIRSDNADGDIADDVRGLMAVVGVPQGWLRDSSRYVVSPDGLRLSYRVEDEQQFKMPPSPAYKADGEYSETSSNFSPIRWGQAQVRLHGGPNTSQADLVQTAMSVVMQKLSGRGVSTNDQSQAILESAAVRVGMYNNWVEVMARGMVNQGKGRLFGVGGFFWNAFKGTTGDGGIKDITATPNDDPNYQPEYLPYGTETTLIQAAAYYDPSLRGVTVDENTGQLTAGLQVGHAGVRKEP